MFNLPSFLKGENRRTCRVKDDSLKPVLNKGQRMLLQVDDNPQEGMIVLACNATEAAIGYYEKVGDHYQLRPPNSNYPPIPIPEPEWIVIGYLVAKIPSVSERKGSITWDFDDGIRE